MSGAGGLLVTVQTFDGMEIFADFTTKDGADWAKIYATFNPELRERKPGEKEANGPAVSTAPEEDVMREAEAINARTAGWYYRLPQEKYDLLSRRIKDFLEEKPVKPKAPSKPKVVRGGSHSEPEGKEEADQP